LKNNNTKTTSVPARGSAFGQAFVFGEHAVVYGRPALCAAIPGLTTTAYAKLFEMGEEKNPRVILKSALGKGLLFDDGKIVARNNDLRLAVESVAFIRESLGINEGLEVTIKSGIPPKSGLSSSSAFLVSAIRAVARAKGLHDLSDKRIFKIVFPLQKKIHGGRASGSEIVTSSRGGWAYITGRPGKFKKVKTADGFFPEVVVGDTMVRTPTSVMVNKVARRRMNDQEFVDGILDEIGGISSSGRLAVENGDAELIGALMNANQALLRTLGVSSPKLDSLTLSARLAGALGSKLTGGGGGKCMIALVPAENPAAAKRIERGINRSGGKALGCFMLGDLRE